MSSTRSPYAYVAGNPLNRADPSGKCGLWGNDTCLGDAWNATGGQVVNWVQNNGSNCVAWQSNCQAYLTPTQAFEASLGVVAIVGGTLATFGTADLAIALGTAIDTTGFGGFAEAGELVTHAPFVMGAGLGGVGAGAYLLWQASCNSR